jgi:hypothetical protein
VADMQLASGLRGSSLRRALKALAKDGRVRVTGKLGRAEMWRVATPGEPISGDLAW